MPPPDVHPATIREPGAAITDRPPPLEPGDVLTAPEFRRRAAASPRIKRAELIDGVVYVSPPVSGGSHGSPHSRLDYMLRHYAIATPGTDVVSDSTLRIDAANEPQPDLMLFVEPGFGGSVRLVDGGFVEGTPELVAEIASSSTSYDLHQKRALYCRAGVKEYVVWRTRDAAFDVFELVGCTYTRASTDDAGIWQSTALPGLWLNLRALLRRDLTTARATVDAGLADATHAAFVSRLAKHHGERR
jgi:Uma2 family endonuclease